MTKFIGYVRVSTADQGKHGHGLDAQKAAIASFVEREGGELVKTFQDIQSGSNDQREGFWTAVEACLKAKATMVVSKHDRLSRSGLSFAVELDKLERRGFKFEAADMPGASKLMVRIMSVLGQDERERISTRTREGLAAAKAKGIKLGNPRWRDSIEAAREAREANVEKQRKLVLPIIKGLQSSGISTLAGLASALNERGIQTPQGRRWHAMTVKRLVEA